MKSYLKFIFLLSVIILFFAPEHFPQTSSPYSRIGIGDIYYSYSARTLGMGQSGIADAQQNFITFYNPAGLYNLRRTRIEFSLNYFGTFLSDNDFSAYYGKAKFGGFQFAFPVSNRYGIGAVFGLVPFSNVSYKVTSNNSSVNGNYETSYEGKGGLSKIFVGSSYKLPFDLSIGATLDYYFGTIDYSSSIIFPDETNADAAYTNEYRPKGIGTTVGIISPDLSPILNIGSITNLRFGFSYNYIAKLETDTVLTSVTTLGTDTVTTGIVNMKVPGRLTAGLSFMLNKKYLLSLDYAFQPWENYSFNEKSFNNLAGRFKF